MSHNRVFDRVLLGYTEFFFLLFFLQLGPISAPDRPGPESIRQAGPGFKTMDTRITLDFFYLIIWHKIILREVIIKTLSK